jgi:hypothetical protein
MQRHRKIAAAPERPASQAWATISQLVVDTLDRSPSISAAEVDTAMAVAAPAGMMLIAGGHLDRHPLVVVADPVHLSITTVSGVAASALEENLAAVPGGASATAWTVHLPTPAPVGDAVRTVVAGQAHLSADEPAADMGSRQALAEEGVINLDALADRQADR